MTVVAIMNCVVKSMPQAPLSAKSYKELKNTHPRGKAGRYTGGTRLRGFFTRQDTEEVKDFMMKREEVKATNLMLPRDFSCGVDDQGEEEELEMLDSSGDKINSGQKSKRPLPRKTKSQGSNGLVCRS
ncbi:hypothetical protein V6N12_050072 [Hibiscus sabdariffa]|uniref:Uncharacterized protein n=1 Tax=Hibiscus sabdariffa TaxID=183260 RepID=A0ABR2GBC7_9ROSI